MTERAFASWVEPIAAQLRESRGQIGQEARTLPPEVWATPSPLDGWTYKDLLAHLAVGDWVLQTVLRAVVAKEPVDVKRVTDLDKINAENARLLKERRGSSPEELIAEVEAEGVETRELLGGLTNQDENLKQEDAPVSLSQYLAGFPGHDREHLAHLRTALDNIML